MRSVLKYASLRLGRNDRSEDRVIAGLSSVEQVGDAVVLHLGQGEAGKTVDFAMEELEKCDRSCTVYVDEVKRDNELFAICGWGRGEKQGRSYDLWLETRGEAGVEAAAGAEATATETEATKSSVF